MFFLEYHEEVVPPLANDNRFFPRGKLRYADHSIRLNCQRVIEFLVSAEICTIVTSSAGQSRWCCGKVAPRSGLFVPAFLD